MRRQLVQTGILVVHLDADLGCFETAAGRLVKVQIHVHYAGRVFGLPEDAPLRLFEEKLDVDPDLFLASNASLSYRSRRGGEVIEPVILGLSILSRPGQYRSMVWLVHGRMSTKARGWLWWLWWLWGCAMNSGARRKTW